MTAAGCFPPFPGFRPAAGRFALALAASSALHLFLATSLALEAPRWGARPAGGDPIAARLLPPAAPAPEPPVDAFTAGPRAAAGNDSRRVAPARKRVFPKPEAASSPGLPQALDPTYYSARDLDVYPRPAVPLDLDRFAGGVAGGRFRLALLIDEGGVVNEITVVEAGPPGRWQEQLRAALAATRFIPGKKDGRAVKSRVLLSVSLGPEQREP